MRLRYLVCITLLALCHLQVSGQALINAVPQPQQNAAPAVSAPDSQVPSSSLPDDPALQMLPVAQPEPQPLAGVPVRADADDQGWKGNVWTGTGRVEFHYRDYVLHADKVIYNQVTTEVQAEGHVQVQGGPNDVLINADHGDMRLNLHTGRFFQVSGSQGIRSAGRTVVYSTANPFLFSGRVLIQTGEGSYRLVDGSMTNCRLPKPDWRLISRLIELNNGEASTRNTVFKFVGIPLFYLPYLRHPIDDTGRETGFLIPVLSNSTIKGFIVGEQFYWVINRSMDMIVGSEYFSKRGWAPNGDFRYKGPGLDHLTIRWNALLDRGVEQEVGNTIPTTAASIHPAQEYPALTQESPALKGHDFSRAANVAPRTWALAPAGSLSSEGGGGLNPRINAAQRSWALAPATATSPADLIPGPIGEELVNQGGVDVVALGRKDLQLRLPPGLQRQLLASHQL
jgi:LPS-assembly protein